jgi:putative transposase
VVFSFECWIFQVGLKPSRKIGQFETEQFSKFKLFNYEKITFTETQILAVLRQYDGGRPAEEICREHGISRATLYQWKKKYAGMDGAQVRKPKELE